KPAQRPSAPGWAKPGSGSEVAQIRWPRSWMAASVGPGGAIGSWAAAPAPMRTSIAARPARAAGAKGCRLINALLAKGRSLLAGRTIRTRPGPVKRASVQDLAEKQLGALVLRIGEERLRLVLFDDLPLVHE